jgi:effector-binding domain-containing protein
MKALKIVGIVLFGLVALILIAGLIAPKTYQVERSASIGAPKSMVFRHIQYWKNWQAWSPWAAIDSTMKVTLEGVDGTEGSTYKWTGVKTGEGIMTNSGVKPGETLYYRMRFIKPWKAEADGYVGVAQEGEKTTATWRFTGRTPYPWNALTLFMNMDKALGGDFEKGLGLLKNVCEKEMARALEYKIRAVPFPARTYAAIRKTLTMDQLQAFFAESIPALMEALGRSGIRPAGAPCGIYYTYDEATMSSDMAAAVPANLTKTIDGIVPIRLPAAKAYVIDYAGPHEGSILAYDAFDLYFSRNNQKPKMPVVEEYLTDPEKEKDPARQLTRIYFFAE